MYTTLYWSKVSVPGAAVPGQRDGRFSVRSDHLHPDILFVYTAGLHHLYLKCNLKDGESVWGFLVNVLIT